MIRITCYDLTKQFPNLVCCESCHEDEEEGVNTLLEFDPPANHYLYDKVTVAVCCKVADVVRDKIDWEKIEKKVHTLIDQYGRQGIPLDEEGGKK